VSVDSSAALRWSLLAGACCNDAALSRGDGGRWEVVGDPTEGAMLVAAIKAGLSLDMVAAELPRVATIPPTSRANGARGTILEVNPAAPL
jgi:cation-transporting P-type ATPase F